MDVMRWSQCSHKTVHEVNMIQLIGNETNIVSLASAKRIRLLRCVTTIGHLETSKEEWIRFVQNLDIAVHSRCNSLR